MLRTGPAEQRELKPDVGRRAEQEAGPGEERSSAWKGTGSLILPYLFLKKLRVTNTQEFGLSHPDRLYGTCESKN